MSKLSEYQRALLALPEVIPLPGGWELTRVEDLSCYEIRDPRRPLTGFCGLPAFANHRSRLEKLASDVFDLAQPPHLSTVTVGLREWRACCQPPNHK